MWPCPLGPASGRAWPRPPSWGGGGGGALSSRLLVCDLGAPLRVPRTYPVFVAAGHAAHCPVPCAPVGPFALRPVLWARPPPPLLLCTRLVGGGGKPEPPRLADLVASAPWWSRTWCLPFVPPPLCLPPAARAGRCRVEAQAQAQSQQAERALVRSFAANCLCSSCPRAGAPVCPLQG